MSSKRYVFGMLITGTFTTQVSVLGNWEVWVRRILLPVSIDHLGNMTAFKGMC